MYGVPANLNLSHFIGSSLEQIACCQYITHFNFACDPPGVISVEGKWELIDELGRIVDRDQDPDEREAYYLHVILGKDVVGAEVEPPRSFALIFESGHRLRIYDDSERYESFSIQPGNIYI